MLNTRGGIECDFTVTRLAAERFLDRHRHRVRPPRPGVDHAAPPGRRRRSTVRDVTSAHGLPTACGGRGPATSSPRVCDDDLSFRVHAGPAGHRRRRAVLGAAGDVRRRARAGSCTRRPSSGCALWDTLVAAGGRSGWCPAGTGRSTRCGSRRATSCGGPTSRRRPTRTRRAGVRRADRQGVLGGRRSARPCGGTDGASLASCSTTAGPSRSATSRCGRRRAPWSGGCRAVASATSSTLSIAYAWVPVAHATVGTPPHRGGVRPPRRRRSRRAALRPHRRSASELDPLRVRLRSECLLRPSPQEHSDAPSDSDVVRAGSDPLEVAPALPVRDGRR